MGMGIAATGASGKFLAISSRQLLNRAFHKFLNKPKSLNGHDSSLMDDVSLAGGSTCHSSAALFPVNHIASNGETRDSVTEDTRAEYPEHVLKVFKADQTCKYLLIHKETTAHEVVMLSLQVGRSLNFLSTANLPFKFMILPGIRCNKILWWTFPQP